MARRPALPSRRGTRLSFWRVSAQSALEFQRRGEGKLTAREREALSPGDLVGQRAGGERADKAAEFEERSWGSEARESMRSEDTV
jgi:hypothetical protein